MTDATTAPITTTTTATTAQPATPPTVIIQDSGTDWIGAVMVPITLALIALTWDWVNGRRQDRADEAAARHQEAEKKLMRDREDRRERHALLSNLVQHVVELGAAHSAQSTALQLINTYEMAQDARSPRSELAAVVLNLGRANALVQADLALLDAVMAGSGIDINGLRQHLGDYLNGTGPYGRPDSPVKRTTESAMTLVKMVTDTIARVRQPA